MEFEPAASVEVVYVATPLLIVLLPSVVLPFLNVTVPVAARGATEAVKVRGMFNVEGFADAVRAMLNETVKVGPVAVIPATVTVTGPLTAFEGTETTICELLQLLAETGTPPNSTTLSLWVAPNPPPLIVTGVPTPPEVGEM